jgi:hypothetical protein
MPDESATRECPFCKEEVKAAAVRCRHCQAALVPTRPDHEGVCPFCKEEINVEAIRCKHCQADLAGAKAIIVYDRQSGIGGSESDGVRGFVVDGMRNTGQLPDPSLGGIIIHALPTPGLMPNPLRGAIIVVGG